MHVLDHAQQALGNLKPRLYDTPILGGPVDNPSTYRNLWISGVQISHSYVSYTETHFCIFNSQIYKKNMIDYVINNPFTVLLYKKGIHVLVMLKYNTRQNEHITKSHPALIPHTIPYASQPPAPDLYLKRGSHDEVSKAQ